MGKRRDKTGRRQILQLNDETPPVNIPRNSLHGLMQYSDSEEEGTRGQSEVVSADEGRPESARKIDLEVADFLKEIDALQPTANSDDAKEASQVEESPTTSSPQLRESSPKVDSPSCRNIEKPESPEIQSSLKEIESFYESHSPSTNHLDEVCSSDYHNNVGYTVWQQCYDESSGYTYFWNMETNEVTWECPPDYNSQAQEIQMSLAAMANDAYHSEEPDKYSAASKKYGSHSKEDMNEGKIIPITCFEPSLSSEDSSEEELVQKKKPKQKPAKSHKLSNKKSSKLIGPQLQQGHPSLKNSSRKAVTHKEEVVIGPQLPSYYIPRETKPKEDIPMSSSNGKNTDSSKTNSPAAESSGQLQTASQSSDRIPSALDVPSPSNGVFTKSSTSTNPDKSGGQEPDSTTRKENNSESRKSSLCSKDKTSLKRTLQTLVQYGESGSEDEIDDKTEKMPVFDAEKYRRDGRQGFGFKDYSGYGGWQKNEKSVDKDSSKISFVKSKEVLDLNELNRQELSKMEERIKHENTSTVNGEAKSAVDVSSCSTTTSTGSSSLKQGSHESEETPAKRYKTEDGTETTSGVQDVEHLEMLSNIMMEKLTFLTIAQGEVSSLCSLLIQLQTRYTDWKENALSSSYFVNRLKETQDVLRQYEMNAMPSGWICDWDRYEPYVCVTS